MASNDNVTWTFIAAGVAAAIELTVMQPLDVVKTRLHLKSTTIQCSDRFSGTSSAILGIYKSEGLRGLWRGYFTGLAIVVPRRGFKFAFNSFLNNLIGDRISTRYKALIAGGLTGACEAVLITPVEVMKVIMQSERTPRSCTMSSFQEVMRSVSRGGVRMLFRGLGATVAKHSLHTCVYFSAYAELKALPWAPGVGEQEMDSLWFSAVSGFFAGAAAGLCNNPFDVLKSRQQVGAAASMKTHSLAHQYASFPCGSDHYEGLWRSAVHVVKTEGPSVLFRGLGAKLARLGPGSAIIFFVYETIMREVRVYSYRNI